MAVELTKTYESFVGTGVLSNYTPEFYALAASQVHVYVDGVLQTLGDDYTLSGLASPDGVAVSANFPLNSNVYIERLTPITQDVDTQNNETILEDVLDGEFDKLTMIAQEISEVANRAVLFPKGEAGQVLAAAAARANLFVSFDAEGNLFLSAGTGADAGLRTDLGTGGGAGLINWLRSATGAVVRSLADWLDDELSVMDFIPLAERIKIRLRTSTADVSYAFKAAETVAVSRGGGRIKVPGGKYRGYVDSTASYIHWAGAGSGCTMLMLPDNAQHTITVNGGPGTSTGVPCGFAFGQIGDGNFAVASQGNRVSGLTYDGNRAGTAAPTNDLHGWGIACTKHQFCNTEDDVIVQNCHAGGVAHFILSHYYKTKATVIDCGNTSIAGDFKPGVDNNSSKYGNADVLVIGGVYSTRHLDNVDGCHLKYIAINPQKSSHIAANQTVNFSHVNYVDGTVFGGCSDYAVEVAANVIGGEIKLRAYGISGIGLREIGGTDIAAQYRAVGVTYDVMTFNSGHRSVMIEGNGADVKVRSYFDCRSTAQGDEFAVQIQGPNVTLDAKIFEAADGTWKARGVVILAGAANVSYRIRYTGAGNRLDDQSGSLTNVGYGSKIDFQWTPATLSGGFSLIGGISVPGYFRQDNGDVRLRGGVSGTAGTVFTLPANMRPTAKTVFGNYAGGIYVSVNADGTVVVTGAGPWLFDGISFPTYP